MDFISVVLMSLSILLPLVAGFFILEKTIVIRKFIIFLFVGFITELILITTSFIGNNVFYVNIYTLIEVILLGRFYVEIIKNEFIKNLIWVFITIISLSGFTSCFSNEINYNTKFYEALLILFCSFSYFIDISENDKNEFNLGYTIIVCGSLIFHGTTVLIFFLTKTLSVEDLKFYKLYLLHSYINMFVNIIYFIGLIYFYKKKNVIAN